MGARDGDVARAFAVSNTFLSARGPATPGLSARGPATRGRSGRFPSPRRLWHGRPFDGLHVRTRGGRALDDTLRICRFLPALRPRAASFTRVAAPLAPRREPLADAVVRFDAAPPLPAFACGSAIIDLAHAPRRRPAEVGPAALAAPPPPAQAIGPCWRAGRPRHRPFGAARPVERCCGPAPRWLRRGALRRRAVSPRFRNPANDDHGIRNHAIRRTAPPVDGPTPVVTVDTLVAHLAGTLGRPAIAPPQNQAGRRWMRGPRCTWYPSPRRCRGGGRAAATAPGRPAIGLDDKAGGIGWSSGSTTRPIWRG